MCAREFSTTSTPRPPEEWRNFSANSRSRDDARCVVVQSQAAQDGPLGRARGGVDLGADVLGQLNGGHPDAACRGVDEDPLPLLEIRHAEERVVGGEEGARHGRRLGVAPPVGDGHEHAVIRHGHAAEGAGEDAGHPVTRRQTW